MKILFPLTLAALVSFTLSAQTGPGYRSPRPTTANIGYEMAIEPRFEGICFDFSEGMAGVMEPNGAGWTCIGTDGKKAVSKSYRVIRPFRDGLAAVEENGKWGYIDKTGREVATPQYGQASDFSEGYGVVSVDLFGDGIHYRQGFLNAKGQIVGHPTFLSANCFRDHHAAVQHKDRTWQVLTDAFTAVSERLPYESVGAFQEGFARVKSGDGYGFIDTAGKLCIAPKHYEAIGEGFSEGLCPVKENGRWGYINTRGEQVIPCKFTLAGPFSCGHAVVSEAEPEASGIITERGVIGHDGRYTIAQGRFSTILSAFSEDYIVVGSEDGKVGFANVNGKVVIPMVYEEARPFHEGYAAVKVGGKWGFLKLL